VLTFFYFFDRDACVGMASSRTKGDVLSELFSDSSSTGWDVEGDAFDSDEPQEAWLGPLGEAVELRASSGWGSDTDNEWGSGEDEEEEEEEEEEGVMSDDEAFIKSLGLGVVKEGLIGDFNL